MGLFDTIRCQARIPGEALLGGREFQTKDLGRRMERFTVTVEGRLIHHRTYRAWGQPVTQQVPELDIEVPLHRDITLSGLTANGELDWYVARFTDGHLEWIRPREDLSDDHREYLFSGDR